MLQGPRTEDAAQLALVQAAIKRYGLKTVAVRPFKLSGDPRERDLGNPLLLTGNADYDVVWVIDADFEFARSLPYRTALPSPVVGDAGLTATGTMNFVVFPMYFLSTALYPLWKLEESGATWVYSVAQFNPFTHAVK